MGEVNTIPMRINGVEGAAGQVKISGGPGVTETFGAPAPAAHVHAAGDVTSGQFPLARLPRAATGNFLEGNGLAANPIFNALVEGNVPNHMSKNKLAFTLNKLLKGAGPDANPTEIDMPAAGATVTKCDTEVFSGNSPDPQAFTDLNVSGVVGANPAIVWFRVYNANNAANKRFAFRPNGETEVATTSLGLSMPIIDPANESFGLIVCPTDGAGIVEWWYEQAAQAGVTIDVIAYIS